jgi:hypothetical protein
MSAAGYMLENPSIRGYRFCGDNASGADNQQERPSVMRRARREGSPSQWRLESSEAIRQPPRFDDRGEDMVLALWRHRGS